LAKVVILPIAINGIADRFEVNQTLVLRFNICGENKPPSSDQNH